MLCLSRRLYEGVWIGDYRVVVIGIEKGKVRLGIVAPEDVLIARDEVREKMLARRQPPPASGQGREGGG
jgi:carbon storage regulator CsrA